MPWLPAQNKRRFRVTVFKSGDSLALRLPSGLDPKAGALTSLEVGNGEVVTFQPVERPRRKFDIGKVAGSASSLGPIAANDRLCVEPRSTWPGLPAGNGEADCP